MVMQTDLTTYQIPNYSTVYQYLLLTNTQKNNNTTSIIKLTLVISNNYNFGKKKFFFHASHGFQMFLANFGALISKMLLVFFYDV